MDSIYLRPRRGHHAVHQLSERVQGLRRAESIDGELGNHHEWLTTNSYFIEISNKNRGYVNYRANWVNPKKGEVNVPTASLVGSFMGCQPGLQGPLQLSVFQTFKGGHETT